MANHSSRTGNTVSVISTVAQADGFQVEIQDSVLLASRYFPNGEGDNFMGKEVLFDFESSDLEKGACFTSGYGTANTTAWRANSVVPPRVGQAEVIDPKDLDRQLFERLCRAQGADLNRAQAFQDLLTIKAGRLAKRIDRTVELLASMVLRDGKIDVTQPQTTAGGSPSDHILCKYYDESKGADNHFIPAIAWNVSTPGVKPNPYNDVCRMINEGMKHGKKYEDLILGAEAWAALSSDEKFAKFAGATFHSEGMVIDFGDIDGAQHVARAVFNGVQLNVIVYSGAYKNGSGVLVPFIDPNAAIIISSDIGRTLCGGCTLLADNVSYDLSGSFIDMNGKYILHLYKDFQNQELNIRSESRPLPAPKHSVNEYDWIYCDTSMSISGGEFGDVAKGLSFDLDEGVTWTTNPSCAATAVVAGKTATITAGAVADKTVKYYAMRNGVKDGEALTLSSTLLQVPVDADRDTDGKIMIFATAV